MFIETKRPELKDLCKHVLPLYAAQWRMIGIILGMQSGQLEVIKADYPNNAVECCTNLFIKWLQGNENVTWEKMFEAIDFVTSSLSFGNTGITTTTATTTISTTNTSTGK